MNTCMGFDSNSHSNLSSSERNLGNGCGVGDMGSHVHVLGSSSSDDAASAEEENSLPRDNFDTVLRYLNEMLMEGDLDHRPCMYQDLLALQAAEKSFYDALSGKDNSSTIITSADIFASDYLPFGPLSSSNEDVQRLVDSYPNTEAQLMQIGPGERRININGIRHREDDEHREERRTKQFASSLEEYDPIEMYDKVLLCPSGNPGFYTDSSSCASDEDSKYQRRHIEDFVLPEEPKRGRPKAGQRRPNIREIVDLRSLLTQCAQSVAIFDNKRAQELLKKIRQHSSPHGDSTERLAHYFANALEARISGMGTTLYLAISTRRVSAAETLKAYQSYVLACPFKRMSNIFADKSIGRLTKGSSTVHIIDFGILYGFQWPCMIQGVSVRPEGPPKIRITGIDLPQPGFRPAERVEETGRRLERYSKRFKVPFEFQAIAKKWETIKVEDLNIRPGETVVVNCLYRLRNVPDETAESCSPRDAVLTLINKINPDFFVHGVLNGSYNIPFFETRFRDSLYHFSSLFDMFDKTLPRENQDRFRFEKEMMGREVMNVIACEGIERVERPETYKQWQVRNQRAGFTQLPLIQDIVKEIRGKVRMRYHKDFLVNEDNNWILQGWKGRVIFAISCWKPTKQGGEEERFD